MELYTLNLRKAIGYEALATADWNAVHEAALALADRDELITVLEAEALVRDDEDGPHAADPLPAPTAAGSRKSNITSATAVIELTQGSHLFAQGRYENPASVHALLDWFVREAWWQREEAEGPYYIRWVREDGKTALQVLRKKR